MSEKNVNTIGKDFTFGQLVKFVAAPVVSKIAISLLQTIDDGLFMSRYVGQDALSAFSIALPWFMFVDAFGMMISTISVKCSVLMGEKKNDQANSYFTTISLVSVGIGAFFSLILTLFRKKILILLGATDVLLPYALQYMNVSRFYTPMVMLSYIFTRFFVIAGKPKLSVASTLTTTFCNFFFDWLFIVKLNIGVVGAAYANLIGYTAATLIGIFFYGDKNQEVHFAKPVKEWFKLTVSVCRLGFSQFLTSLSVSVNCYISNIVLLAYGKEGGVAAYTIVNNVTFMLMNGYWGLFDSASPVASYAYGERNAKKLAKSFKQITWLTTLLTAIIITGFVISKNTIINMYLGTSDNKEVYDMVVYGMKFVPYIFIVFGYNVMVQTLSLSVGNEKITTILSTLENVIFANLAIILLPKIFGLDGVWYAFLVGELLALIFSLYAVYANRDVYGYGKKKIATFTQF